jgi:hypothetical protein
MMVKHRALMFILVRALKNLFGCQVGKGDRGDVTILPTLVINQRQYRGWCDFGPSFVYQVLQ